MPRAGPTSWLASDPVAHRAGYAAVVGRPNVGKSTLLNSLVGQKISITSRKPQTTRQRVTGILTREDSQIVFVDTPGFQTSHASALTRLMNRTVTSGLADVAVIIWVVDALRVDDRDTALADVFPREVPVVLALNKIDRVRDKAALLPIIKNLSARFGCAAIIPVSARKRENLGELVGAVAALLPEAPRLFEPDEVTTLSERFFAAELIREQLFRLLGEELPYRTAVEIASFRHDRGLRRIHAIVLVDRDSQKAIVIGKKGEKLKLIGSVARKQMEAMFGGKVFLEIWVRVKSGWAESDTLLKRLGYDA